MTKAIFTAGYEGIVVDQFMHRLKVHGIEMLVDVRAVPLSRKRGFSKSALSLAVVSKGIEYLHVPAMGCPKYIRDRYKLDEDWSAYSKEFIKYIDSQISFLENFSTLFQQKTCCLMCFEEDYRFCHRTYVARAISSLSGLQIKHIIDQRVIPDYFQDAAA